MTALGNVIALIRQLDDEQAEVPVPAVATPRQQFSELPPPYADSSSLGAVMEFIRGVIGSPDFDADADRVAVESASERVAEIVSRARCVTYARARAAAEMRI